MKCAEVHPNLAAFVAGGLAPSEPPPQCLSEIQVT